MACPDTVVRGKERLCPVAAGHGIGGLRLRGVEMGGQPVHLLGI